MTGSKIIGTMVLFSVLLYIFAGKIKSIKLSSIDFLLFSFLGICFLSLIPANDKVEGLAKLTSLLSYIVLFYLSSILINTRKRLFIVLMVLWFSIFAVSLVNILQTIGINLGLFIAQHIIWVGDVRIVRYSGTFLGVNRFATLQIIGLAITIGLLRFISVRFKAMIITGGFIMLASLYFSYSRSAYLSLGAMFAYYAFICTKRKVFWILLFFFVVGAIFLYLPQNVYEHFISGFTFEDSSTRMRLQQYTVAAEVFEQNWLLGVGIANQSNILIDTYLLEGGLHCLPLSILLETGVFGFLTFCWLICSGWFCLIRSSQRTKDPLLQSTFLMGLLAVLGLLVHNLFHNFMYMSILGLIGGILNGAWQIKQKEMQNKINYDIKKNN